MGINHDLVATYLYNLRLRNIMLKEIITELTDAYYHADIDEEEFLNRLLQNQVIKSYINNNYEPLDLFSEEIIQDTYDNLHEWRAYE